MSELEMNDMLDKIEAFAMRVAAKGYLAVTVAAFIYILVKGNWRIVCATLIMVGGFVAYANLDDEE